jgi:hypothetical protein
MRSWVRTDGRIDENNEMSGLARDSFTFSTNSQLEISLVSVSIFGTESDAVRVDESEISRN